MTREQRLEVIKLMKELREWTFKTSDALAKAEEAQKLGKLDAVGGFDRVAINNFSRIESLTRMITLAITKDGTKA